MKNIEKMKHRLIAELSHHCCECCSKDELDWEDDLEPLFDLVKAIEGMSKLHIMMHRMEGDPDYPHHGEPAGYHEDHYARHDKWMDHDRMAHDKPAVMK